MISAKNSLFREEIRRRQIDQKFRARRMELLRKEELSRTFDENEEILIEGRNILHNFKFHNNEKNYYESLESLCAFKKHFSKLDRNMVIKLVTEDPYLVNLFSEVLEAVNNSELEWKNKTPFFELIIKMLSHIIVLHEVTDKYIMESRIIEELIPYLLEYDHHKDSILEDLFNFLSDATSCSQSLSNYYTRLEIPSILIKLMVSLGPNVETKYLTNFLCFLRCYTEEMREFQFTKLETEAIISVALEVSKSAINANVKTEEVYEKLTDSLKVLKELFNREHMQINHPSIDAEFFLEIISEINYPFEVKKEALFIIDHIIYKDDQNEITNELVFDKALIARLWSVHEDLRYIVVNILANIVLNADYKKFFIDLIYPIRVKIQFCSEAKSTYTFIKNYFCSQNFLILTPNDENMIEMLRELENNGVETIGIEATIWYGLIKANNYLRPPAKVTSNLMIQEVSELVDMIRNENYEEACERRESRW